MIWKDLWKIIMGSTPIDDFLAPYSASLMFFIITMSTGFIIRSLNKMFAPESIRGYIADFSATMEICAYFFENNFIYKNYGSISLFVAIVIECMIANRSFMGASENPCHAFMNFVNKKIDWAEALTLIAVQTAAGFASYHFARGVWALDMVPDHRERYMETSCAADLNVALITGFAIELGASLIDTWLGMQTVAKMSLLDEILKLANGSLMIVLGINMTGMYFNPAMASGHTYGCHGADAWEHFVVYWIGPFIGCYAAHALDKMFHVDVVEWEKEKSKKLE